MPNTIYTMEAANLICGDHDAGENQPGVATYLALRTVKLPNLEENYVEHIPGGGVAAVEIYTHINRLECTFTMAGWQPRVQGLMGLGSVQRAAQRFTAYGVVRDQKLGQPLRAQAIMFGRLGQVNPGPFRKGDLFELECAIKGITHYEFILETAPGSFETMYLWDFFNNLLVINGVPVNARENQILGIQTDYVGDLALSAAGAPG